MENPKENNKLSTAQQFTQNDIPGLLEKVNEQIKAIKGDLPKATKTTGDLNGFGTIASIKTVENLLKAYSMVTSKQKAYDLSAKEILPEGVKKPPLKIDGSSVSAWQADIKGRIVVVARKTELEKLEKVKAKLEANLSAEAKLAKDLADISNILTE
jgi:hypothetical protein